MGRKFGFSWSAKRALGISSLKQKIARTTGIPTTRSGRQRKIGRIVSGGGLRRPQDLITLPSLLLWPNKQRRAKHKPSPEIAETAEFILVDAEPRRTSLIGGIATLVVIAVIARAAYVGVRALESSTPATKAAAVNPLTTEVNSLVNKSTVESTSNPLAQPELEPSIAQPIEPPEPDAIDTQFVQLSDQSGKFETEAHVKSMTNGMVVLQKRSDKEVRVPLERLSEKSQKVVLEQLKIREHDRRKSLTRVPD